MYVDGLQKHLLETADTDAPTPMGVMVPMNLYADDPVMMPESATRLQKQLDALASFCAREANDEAAAEADGGTLP